MANVLACVILLAIPAVVLNCSLVQKLVDMSYVYDKSTIGWLNNTPFRMNVTQNGTTEERYWLQTEEIFSATHWGTHIDAPCHIAKGRWTLEDIPLTQLVAPAAVVDITHRAATDPDALLLISDLQLWELTWGRTLDDTILLVRTGWGFRWPNREAYTGTPDRDVTRLRFPGVSAKAARWVAQNRRIYGLGIDTLSLDSGVNTLRGLPAHQALLGANIFGLENVANMHMLPGYGAQLHVSPMRLGGEACGSPARIIAVLL